MQSTERALQEYPLLDLEQLRDAYQIETCTD